MRVSVLAALAAALALAAPWKASADEVRLYTERHYAADQEIMARFTEQTGIEVKVVKAGANELIERLRSERESPQADLYVAVDAAALDRADAAGLLQKIASPAIEERIPEGLRGRNGTWIPLTMRARVVVCAKDRVAPDERPETYADLADLEWRGRILIRSSSSAYNQSLLASILAAEGREAALEWAEGVKRNMARPPQGGDRDQVRAVAQGLGDLAVTNTYYLGLLEQSDDPKDREARAAVEVVFPNQDGRGTHVNVSGAGIVAGAANRDHALRLLEFLTSDEIQAEYQELTSEYAVVEGIEPEPLQKRWGEFKPDLETLHELAGKHEEAIRLFDLAGWQ